MLMASYNAGLKGYIADVPQFWFKRADGTVFVNKKVTQCSLNPNTDFMEIRAGWSPYASAYIPGQSTMEVQITMGDFDPALFAVSNAVKDGFTADSNFVVPVTERLGIDATTHKVTLTYTPVAGSAYVPGLKETDETTVTDGKYKVDTENKTIEFNSNETGDANGFVEVTYDTVAADAQSISIDNQSAACGETVLKWPVYSDGKDCTDSKIINYVIVRIFRTRVTTQPGFTFVKVLYAAMHTDTSLNGETLTAA